MADLRFAAWFWWMTPLEAAFQRDQVFNMRYEQPTSGKPVEFDGKEYTDQLSLGTDLVKRYKLRTVTDITSCSTCHR